MNATMMVAGYVWTGIVLIFGTVVCGDYLRRTVQAKRHARKMRALSDRIMADLASLERAHRAGQIRAVSGYILESRVFIPGDTDQDVIARLTGEVQ